MNTKIRNETSKLESYYKNVNGVNEESEGEIEEISEEIVGIVYKKPSRSDSAMYCDEVRDEKSYLTVGKAF